MKSLGLRASRQNGELQGAVCQPGGPARPVPAVTMSLEDFVLLHSTLKFISDAGVSVRVRSLRAAPTVTRPALAFARRRVSAPPSRGSCCPFQYLFLFRSVDNLEVKCFRGWAAFTFQMGASKCCSHSLRMYFPQQGDRHPLQLPAGAGRQLLQHAAAQRPGAPPRHRQRARLRRL